MVWKIKWCIKIISVNLTLTLIKLCPKQFKKIIALEAFFYIPNPYNFELFMSSLHSLIYFRRRRSLIWFAFSAVFLAIFKIF